MLSVCLDSYVSCEPSKKAECWKSEKGTKGQSNEETSEKNGIWPRKTWEAR